MGNTIKNGNLIIIVKKTNYKVGDIVCFIENNQIIVHRIIEINNNTFTSKGDNNKDLDNPINKTQICGKVVFNLTEFKCFN